MTRDIALLRGVNVGGRKLSMKALRDSLEDAGCSDVTTYIQSGNVVFTRPDRAPKDLARLVGTIASDVAGFEVPVVVRTLRELEQAVDRNPYPKATGTKLHVVFFAKAPTKASLQKIDLRKFAPEHCTVVGKDLFLYLPDGIGRAKLSVAIEKARKASKGGDPGTARNWNTVLKLVELAGG